MLGCKGSAKDAPDARASTPTQVLEIVTGKGPATVRIGDKTIAVRARSTEPVGVASGVVHVKAESGSGTPFEADLTVAPGKRYVVPVAAEQCFARLDVERHKVERQPIAGPLEVREIVLTLSDAHRRVARLVSHVGQYPCSANALGDDELYDVVAQSIAWEDVVAADKGSGEDTDDGTTPEERAFAEQRRPALTAFLDLVDAAVGSKRVATIDGRMSAAIWTDAKGHVAIANLASEALEPPKGERAQAMAKELGTTIKKKLAGGTSSAFSSVYGLEDLRMLVVSLETTKRYSMYRGIARDVVPVKHGEHPSGAVFLYELGSLFWVTTSMKAALTKVGVDFTGRIKAQVDSEAAAVDACMAKLAKSKTVRCSKAKTEGEAAARLRRLLEARPKSDVLVQVRKTSTPRGGDVELILTAADAPPPARNANDDAFPYALKIAPDALTAVAAVDDE